MSNDRARWFFGKVTAMRQAQREYFKTRSQSALRQSKALEREVDAEIERVNKILGAPTAFPTQGDIFSQ
ncbi:MAG: hypothetical protein IKP11_04645 [Paludibacteraceae bacterium]|nr:hypothetical protein [Paludibacteraceae bacterium]